MVNAVTEMSSISAGCKFTNHCPGLRLADIFDGKHIFWDDREYIVKQEESFD